MVVEAKRAVQGSMVVDANETQRALYADVVNRPAPTARCMATDVCACFNING